MKENKIIKIISILINLTIVVLIIYFIKDTNSDKSPIIFIILYPLLILLNLTMLLTFLALKKPYIISIFKTNLVILLALIFPIVLFICSV